MLRSQLYLLTLLLAFSSASGFCAEEKPNIGDDFALSVYGDVANKKIIDNSEKKEVAPQVSLPLSLSLFGKVNVNGDRIYLKDISKCLGYANKCEEYYGIDLGASPSPGKRRRISLSQIKDILMTEADGVAFDIKGPDVVEVNAAYLELDAKNLKDALLSYMDSLFSSNSEYKVLIDSISLSGKIKVRPGDYVLNFSDSSSGSDVTIDSLLRKTGRMIYLTVQHKPIEEDVSARTFTVSVRYSIMKLLPVASVELKRGKVLTDHDFSLEWRKMRSRSSSLAISAKQIRGLVVRQTIRGGSLIRLSQLEKQVMVKRGQMVKLRINSGLLDLSGRARALGSGSLGDYIEVIYPVTRKRLSGKIIEKSVVEVVL